MIRSRTHARLLAVLLMMISVTGCRAVEGEFSPGCMAFAGDRVSLHEGRFSWDRFTDARRVDDAGRTVDPFPDFPKTGPYTVTDNRLDLRSGDGELIASWYLHEDGSRMLLLSAEEEAAWASSGEYPECPLVRDDGA